MLIKILQHRYPNLFSVETLNLLEAYLSAADDAARSEILIENEVDDTLQVFITASVEGWDGVYPCKLGEGIHSNKVKEQLVLFLVSTKHGTGSRQ